MGSWNSRSQVLSILQGGSLAFFENDHDRMKPKCVCVLLIIQANICWAKILNYVLYDSHTQSSIAATMPFPTPSGSTLNPTIVNSQHSPPYTNMINVIKQYTIQWKESQIHFTKLHNITVVSSIWSAWEISSHNVNSWITVPPVDSVLTQWIWSLVAARIFLIAQRACGGGIHNAIVLAKQTHVLVNKFNFLPPCNETKESVLVDLDAWLLHR